MALIKMIPVGNGGSSSSSEIQCYHPTYTGAAQNISANGGTKIITILDENDEPIENAKPFDCWVGIRSITMSGSSFSGWGRLTKEDSGSKVPFSYGGNDFTTSGYNTNLYMTFNKNKIILTNTSTATIQIYGCYIHYTE